MKNHIISSRALLPSALLKWSDSIHLSPIIPYRIKAKINIITMHMQYDMTKYFNQILLLDRNGYIWLQNAFIYFIYNC